MVHSAGDGCSILMTDAARVLNINNHTDANLTSTELHHLLPKKHHANAKALYPWGRSIKIYFGSRHVVLSISTILVDKTTQM